ncbi:MAG: lysophospholipid acyltransferase family protein ['Conium maculatum' witches'-broom phytoplasma]|nr:lysophospholipid acyltransferase family protein ['Conium maculatum' witches'-broom phytoplasma]
MFTLFFMASFVTFYISFFFYCKCGIAGYFLSFFASLALSWVMVLLVFFFMMFINKRLKINNSFQQKVVASVSKLILRFFRIKVTVHNRELIPYKGNLVIYSNHKTNFDPFIIACAVDRTMSFSPKDDLYKGRWGWFLSYYFNSIHCLKIVRGNPRATVQNLNQAIENVKQELAMLIFPEGGVVNKKNDKIISTLDGAYKIAFKGEANILPITLKGAYKMRKRFWFKRKKVEVIIHPHIKYEDYKDKNTQQIGQEVADIINSAL